MRMEYNEHEWEETYISYEMWEADPDTSFYDFLSCAECKCDIGARLEKETVIHHNNIEQVERVEFTPYWSVDEDKDVCVKCYMEVHEEEEDESQVWRCEVCKQEVVEDTEDCCVQQDGEVLCQRCDTQRKSSNNVPMPVRVLERMKASGLAVGPATTTRRTKIRKR